MPLFWILNNARGNVLMQGARRVASYPVQLGIGQLSWVDAVTSSLVDQKTVDPVRKQGGLFFRPRDDWPGLFKRWVIWVKHLVRRPPHRGR